MVMMILLVFKVRLELCYLQVQMLQCVVCQELTADVALLNHQTTITIV